MTLSTLLSSPAWSLWRSPSFVALVRAVFVGHRILRRTSVTLFARPARAEYGVPRPVDNTSPGLPRMGPHSQSWQWKKEGSFHCPGATLTRTAIWCSRGVCRAANGASLIRRFDRRTREELMDDLSNVPLGSERRRVLTLGLGHSTAVPVWLPALPAFQPVAVSCHHSAATVFGTTVLMALMHSTAQARSHQLQPFNCSASLATCPACVPACGCILPSQRCDGVWYDCADGSDAQYCPGKVTPAPGQTDCQVLTPPALGSMTVNGLMFSNTTTFVCSLPMSLWARPCVLVKSTASGAVCSQLAS
ncbi:uncharacterized protein LOC135823879 [Sycon ciliatum]|uniref:uncharacterized protein LOC135823879 n=1 Tax=Sycon ciliatum TaxID=27933 RepID=UPI0031F62FD8